MQHAEQIRFGHFGAPEPPHAQLAIDRDKRDQHQANGGEMTQAREVIQPVRIHQRICVGQFVAALMVIDNDDGHPEPAGFGQRLDAGAAAIDCHQQRSALASEHADGLDVGTVAFENSIRNMNQRIKAAMAQVPRQQRRRRGAVDVIVAEDRDFLSAYGSVGDAVGSHFHLSQGIWIGHQFADGRIEKILNRVKFDVPSRQYPRQHLRQLVALRDCQRAAGSPCIEPVTPQLSRRGMRDAEKRRGRFDRQCGCGKRHDAFQR